ASPSQMMASVDTTTLSPAPEANIDERLAKITVEGPAEPAVRSAEPDPLQAFMQHEQLIEAPPTRGWGIQVGAFSQEAQAEQLAHQAAQRLTRNLAGRVAVDTLEGQTPVYRARLITLDEQHAREACRELEVQGMECMVVNASL
ncbi:SPOR domain-containing protein, partial [Halomonas aquamarina]